MKLKFYPAQQSNFNVNNLNTNWNPELATEIQNKWSDTIFDNALDSPRHFFLFFFIVSTISWVLSSFMF